jgi:two-component system chemotaxis response regulator CheB
MRTGKERGVAGHRDIVVIGASSGGVAALLALAAKLPADLPAALFIVVHMAASHRSMLPDLLTSRSKLRAVHAVHGEPVRSGRIYVAPPDNHLMLRPGYLHVARGPKENGHRPAVDALFRSAAASYGPQVIGVVLTGDGDCGTAGLMSIKARGGVAIAQDPARSASPQMPQSAIDHVAVDHVASLEQIPALLDRLVREPPQAAPGLPSRDIMELEGDEPGAPAELSCPLCQGVLKVAEQKGFVGMRCHVGHAFSLDSVAAEQADSAERALWSAVRALEESAALSRRLAGHGLPAIAARFEDRERTQRAHAETIRRILLDGGLLSRADLAVPALAAAGTSSARTRKGRRQIRGTGRRR